MKRLVWIVVALICCAAAAWVGVGVGVRSRDPEIASLQSELDKSREQAKQDLARQEKQLRREAEEQRRKDFQQLSREVDAQRLRRKLEDELGIRITGAAEPFEAPPLLSPEDKWRGDAINVDQLIAALDIVTEEMSLYPDDVVRKSGLKRVVLGRNLRTDHFTLKGFMTIFGTMYLDATLPAEELARTFHHEFFHQLDGAMLRKRLDADAEWKALNPEKPGYSTQQELLMDATWARKPLEERTGFISAYARWNAAEDKAELYEWMSYTPAALDFREDGDDVLKAKRRLLTKRLKAWNEGFGDHFWANARERETRRR
jgi:hypothetical protein